MANIRKRTTKEGGSYYTVQIRLKGYPPQAASFDRLTDARKWAQQTEVAIKEGRHFKTAEAKKHSFADAIDRYNLDILPTRYTVVEQANRRSILSWWRTQIGHHLMSDLTTGVFADCRNSLMKQGASGKPLAPATVHRYFAIIEEVIKRCVIEWHWLEQSPLRDNRIEMPALPKGVIRFLDDEELIRLNTACKESPNQQLYPAFILALSTGMRQAETMNLYWKTPDSPPNEQAWGVVNIIEKCIILHETKNGDRRRLPLSGTALSELQRLSKVRRLDTSLVFPSPTLPQQPIDLRKSWRNALIKANIQEFRWHDLRHTAASYLAMNGATMTDISAILGHRTLQMVKRYSHLSDTHITGVLENMNSNMLGGM